MLEGNARILTRRPSCKRIRVANFNIAWSICVARSVVLAYSHVPYLHPPLLIIAFDTFCTFLLTFRVLHRSCRVRFRRRGHRSVVFTTRKQLLMDQNWFACRSSRTPAFICFSTYASVSLHVSSLTCSYLQYPA